MAYATEDGLVMAADDLLYSEKAGKAVAAIDCAQKVFVAENNILIGSAGMMAYRHIQYEFTPAGFPDFIEKQRALPV